MKNKKIIINEFLDRAKDILNINEDVIWIEDKKKFLEISHLEKYPKRFEIKGAMDKELGLMYISKSNRSIKEIKEVIIHELLHYKFPRKSEKEIRKLTKLICKEKRA